jgi:excisionase family DNA binding protein
MSTLLIDSQIAEILMLTSRQVLKLAKRGEIPAVFLPNGEIRFDYHDVAEWIKTCKQLPKREGDE